MIGGLHERERELGVILGALDEVAAGTGRAVAVEGPAGIGKTSQLGISSRRQLAPLLAPDKVQGARTGTAP